MDDYAMLINTERALDLLGSFAAFLTQSADDNVAAFGNIIESYVCDIEAEADERELTIDALTSAPQTLRDAVAADMGWL